MKTLKTLIFILFSTVSIGYSQISIGEIVVTPDKDVYCQGDTVRLQVSGGSKLRNIGWICELSSIRFTDSTLYGVVRESGDLKLSYFGYLPDSTSQFRIKWIETIQNKFTEYYRVCDRFPVTINGNIINDYGKHEFRYPSSNLESCDSIAVYDISQLDRDRFEATHLFICPGDSAIIHDLVINQDTIQSIALDTFDYNCHNFLTVHSTVADTFAPTIQCYKDTFINALSFQWSKQKGVEEYDVYLNDSYLKTQTSRAYLHQISNENETLNLRIEPKSGLGCNFRGVALTCSTSDTSPVSEKELSNSISVIPNPNSGNFRVEAISKIIHVDVFDSSGRKILTQREQKVDLTSFPNGIYFLKILTESGYFSKRVVKK